MPDCISKYDYDSYIFLSKHTAKFNILSLTCHSTGIIKTDSINRIKQASVPHPHLKKSYMQSLWDNKHKISDFRITIETTHHSIVYM